MPPKTPEPSKPDGLFLKAVTVLALTVAGFDTMGPAKRGGDAAVAEAVDKLSAAMDRRDSAVALELKELRSELVDIAKTMVVSTQEIKDHDRRIGKLETDRIWPSKK
jgi:hypothetical protein